MRTYMAEFRGRFVGAEGRIVDIGKLVGMQFFCCNVFFWWRLGPAQFGRPGAV